jgi:TonB-linked SusC/RagA family outer membrane protein
MKKLFYQLNKVVIYSCLGIIGQLLGVGFSFANTDPKNMESFHEVANESVHDTVNEMAASTAVIRQEAIDVTGKVTAVSDGQGIPGVSILVKGTLTGTVSDVEGNYNINLPNEGDTLVFSSIGFITQEVPVNGRTVIDITMSEDMQNLDEVVVVGYMTQRKADLTGSVAVISSKELEKNNFSNVLQSLQGKVPGMYITGDGNPVGNVNVQIRGLTSMRSAPPLVVIDGLPTNNFNLRDINPNDIASMQVLKDAASASIYGSRAASGVILIETKKGKEGETRINYNGSYGVSSFMNREELMNTQQYGQAMFQAAVNDGLDPNEVTQIYNYEWHRDENGAAILDQVTPIEWLNADETMRSADTDWFKEGSQLGIQNNHQISMLNGTENAKTMFSLNLFENRGTQIHTGFRRYSLRVNSEYNLIEDRLTVGENLSLTHSKINNQNHSHSFLTMPPIVPVYTEDGGWGGTAYDLGMDDYNNPVRMLTMGKDNDEKVSKVVGNVYADLKLFKNFNFKSLYGIDYTSTNLRHIDFTWEEGGGKRDINNGVRGYQRHDFNMTWTNTLNYNLSMGNHALDFLAGIETFRYVFEDLNGFRRDIEFEDYNYAFLNSATGNQEVSGGGDEFTLLSYFSKFNYVYNDKYLLSATLRYDGSSKFGQNNQFGFFPAVSAGWRLSEEEFLEGNSIISDLKLRASWGVNGNSNIPTNALVNFYDADYSSTAYGLAGNETGTLYSGYRRRHIGNQNLRWEATRQTDIGVDFGFFNGSLSGSFDYFYKFTDGMLYEPPYLAAIGEGGNQWINAANMTNTGVELMMTFMSNPSQDFTYSISGNISTFRNKVDDLPESVKFTYGGNGLDDDILGRPLNSFYGFIADGLFQSQDEVDNSPEQPGKGLGRIRYRDLDNDGRITWEHDRTWIGVSDPDFMYGLNVEAVYKNIDFSMFWQGVVGNTVRNDWKTYSDFWNVWTQSGFNHATRLLDAWSPTNPNSDIPALSMINQNDERRVSTYFMESGSYLKLRQIEIGYTAPNFLTSKLGMQQLRVYVTANNLINLKKWWGEDRYTGVDPENPTKAGEYSSPYVMPQIFKVGMNVSF